MRGIVMIALITLIATSVKATAQANIMQCDSDDCYPTVHLLQLNANLTEQFNVNLTEHAHKDARSCPLDSSGRGANLKEMESENKLQVLQDYTENDFTPMNAAARDGNPASNPYSEKNRVLNELLQELQPCYGYQPVYTEKLYRGVDIPKACFQQGDSSGCEDWAARYVREINNKEVLRAFTSTASVATAAFNMYNVQITYLVMCNKGIELMEVRKSWQEDAHRSYPILDSAEDEQEVLFPPNMTEVITERQITGDKSHVRAMLLCPEN